MTAIITPHFSHAYEGNAVRLIKTVISVFDEVGSREKRARSPGDGDAPLAQRFKSGRVHDIVEYIWSHIGKRVESMQFHTTVAEMYIGEITVRFLNRSLQQKASFLEKRDEEAVISKIREKFLKIVEKTPLTGAHFFLLTKPRGDVAHEKRLLDIIKIYTTRMGQEFPYTTCIKYASEMHHTEVAAFLGERRVVYDGEDSAYERSESQNSIVFPTMDLNPRPPRSRTPSSPAKSQTASSSATSPPPKSKSASSSSGFDSDGGSSQQPGQRVPREPSSSRRSDSAKDADPVQEDPSPSVGFVSQDSRDEESSQASGTESMPSSEKNSEAARVSDSDEFSNSSRSRQQAGQGHPSLDVTDESSRPESSREPSVQPSSSESSSASHTESMPPSESTQNSDSDGFSSASRSRQQAGQGHPSLDVTDESSKPESPREPSVAPSLQSDTTTTYVSSPKEPSVSPGRSESGGGRVTSMSVAPESERGDNSPLTQEDLAGLENALPALSNRGPPSGRESANIWAPSDDEKNNSFGWAAPYSNDMPADPIPSAPPSPVPSASPEESPCSKHGGPYVPGENLVFNITNADMDRAVRLSEMQPEIVFEDTDTDAVRTAACRLRALSVHATENINSVFPNPDVNLLIKTSVGYREYETMKTIANRRDIVTSVLGDLSETVKIVETPVEYDEEKVHAYQLGNGYAYKITFELVRLLCGFNSEDMLKLGKTIGGEFMEGPLRLWQYNLSRRVAKLSTVKDVDIFSEEGGVIWRKTADSLKDASGPVSAEFKTELHTAVAGTDKPLPDTVADIFTKMSRKIIGLVKTATDVPAGERLAEVYKHANVPVDDDMALPPEVVAAIRGAYERTALEPRVRFVVIPLNVSYKTRHAGGTSSLVKPENLLIFDVTDRVLYRFDPYGGKETFPGLSYSSARLDHKLDLGIRHNQSLVVEGVEIVSGVKSPMDYYNESMLLYRVMNHFATNVDPTTNVIAGARGVNQAFNDIVVVVRAIYHEKSFAQVIQDFGRLSDESLGFFIQRYMAFFVDVQAAK